MALRNGNGFTEVSDDGNRFIGIGNQLQQGM